jgi:mitogen-activated protein kinase kinase kinase 7
VQVAVKFFESRDNRTALLMEVRQLAVLNHESIVKLFGVAEHGDGTLCMLIEYAENGSLYDLLHRTFARVRTCARTNTLLTTEPGDRRINYTAGHAISWIRQIASAIVYLHSFKPKAIIHRDLKSPNILLTNNCLFSKLADFGTATEQRTVMTNMKGSALWMAPEVNVRVRTNRMYTAGIHRSWIYDRV